MSDFTGLSAKDKRQILSYLQSIKTYSALVEAKLNTCGGGVGTAPTSKKSKSKIDKEAQIRAKFHK